MLKEAKREVTQAHCHVVLNKACPGYAWRAEVKHQMWKLETWLIVIAQVIAVRERGFCEVLKLYLFWQNCADVSYSAHSFSWWSLDFHLQGQIPFICINSSRERKGL